MLAGRAKVKFEAAETVANPAEKVNLGHLTKSYLNPKFVSCWKQISFRFLLPVQAGSAYAQAPPRINAAMAISTQTAAAVRFGEHELDLRSGELTCQGRRKRLPAQSAQLLAYLASRPGKVVLRDELHRHLWPQDTFVDFDQGLNNAIARVREALRDSAVAPRYIETIPKRGYRFIAEVQGAGEIVAGNSSAGNLEARGNPKPIAQPYSRLLRIAAAAVVLVIAAGALLWVRPASSPRVHATKPFTTMQGVAAQPAFSPDGTEMAFTANEAANFNLSRIFVQPLSSTTARPLIEDSEAGHSEWSPRWWPDGRGILYIRRLAHHPDEIWTVNRSGGPPRKMFSGGSLLGFDISPDGKTLVIAKAEKQWPFSWGALWLVDAETRAAKQLTFRAAVAETAWFRPSGDMFPSFSPDGRTVLFSRLESAEERLGTVSVSGGSPEWLASAMSAPSGAAWKLIAGAIWAPDGESLLIAAVHDGKRGLWKLRLRGRQWLPLAVSGDAAGQGLSLAVSKDGRRFAFQQINASINVLRYALPEQGADGSSGPAPVNLTNSNAVNSSPMYSPSGARFAFASDRTGHREIYVARGDGSDAAQVSWLGGDAGTPRWSPDGRQIVFTSVAPARGEHAHIYVVDADGGPAQPLTSGDWNDSTPSFSADGNSIYFTRQRGTQVAVWKVPAAGGQALLVEPDATQPWESADGHSIFYAKVSQAGIFSRRLSGGEEKLIVADAWESVGENPSRKTFFVANDGIYFTKYADPANGAGTQQLRFFDFSTGNSKTMLELTNISALAGANIGIAPDRKSVLLLGAESQSTIMLVEDFRP